MAEVVLREKGACGILVERGMCVVVIVFGENWPSPHLVWRGGGACAESNGGL